MQKIELITKDNPEKKFILDHTFTHLIQFLTDQQRHCNKTMAAFLYIQTSQFQIYYGLVTHQSIQTHSNLGISFHNYKIEFPFICPRMLTFKLEKGLQLFHVVSITFFIFSDQSQNIHTVFILQHLPPTLWSLELPFFGSFSAFSDLS